MAFSRARIKRFNEMAETTPGVGAYNVAVEAKQGQLKDLDRSKYISKLDLSCKQLKDKGIIAVTKGELPKHVEELHQLLRASEEKRIDLEILKIGAEKGKELLDAEVKLLNSQIKMLKEAIHELEVKKKQMEDKETALNVECSCLEKENEKLIKDMDNLSVEFSNMTSLLDSLKLVKSEMMERICELEETKLGLENEITKLRADQVTLTKEKKVLAADLEMTKLLSQKSEQKIIDLEQQIVNFKKVYEILAEEKLKFESEMNKGSETLAKQSLELLRVQEIASCLEIEKRSLEETVKKIKVDNEKLACERDNCKDDLKKVSDDLSKYQVNLADIDERKTICETELLKVNVIKECLSEEISELQEKIFSISSLNASLSSQLSDFKHLKMSNDEELILARREIKIQVEQTEELRLKFEALDKQLDQAKEKCLQVKGLNESLMTQLEEKEKEITMIRLEHHSALESSTQQLRLEFGEVEREQKDKHLKELAAIEQTLQESETKIKAFYEEKISHLELQMNDFESQQKLVYEEKQKQLEHEKVQFECSQQRLWGEKLKDLEERIADLEEEKISYSEKEKSLEDEKVTISIQKNLLEDQVRSLVGERENWRTEYQRLCGQTLLTYEEKCKKLDIFQEEFVKEQTQQLHEKLTAINREKQEQIQHLHDTLHVVEKEKQKQIQQLHDKVQAVEGEKQEQMQKCKLKIEEIENEQKTLKENLQGEYEAKKMSLENRIKENEHTLELKFFDKLQIMENDKENYIVQQEAILKKEKKLLEECKANCEKQILQCRNTIAMLEEKVKQEVLKQQICDEKLIKLKNENVHLEILIKTQKEEYKCHIAEVTKARQIERDARLSELRKLELDKDSLLTNQKALEEQYAKVVSENERLCGLMELMQDEIARLNESYEDYKVKQEAEYKSLLEAADREREGYNTIISEMSEKIEQMEEKGAQADPELQWRRMYEELMARMEPFKEVLETYELERKLLQDRDRYSNEQIEKLTQEAIKNMGHQNHRQKLKYMEKLKLEHIALQKRLCETQEELQRQNALVKKYSEKLEKYEGVKEPGIKKTQMKQTPVKPRVPLKEGNR